MLARENTIDGGFICFDMNAIQECADRLQKNFNNIKEHYDFIDEIMEQIFNNDTWDSRTKDNVRAKYSILKRNYNDLYNTFSQIIDFLDAVIANYELANNLSIF